MYAKIEDRDEFNDQVSRISTLIHDCINSVNTVDYQLISMDEKPGIQALERRTSGVKPGQLARMENEYKRHGTSTLMAAQDVRTGKIIEKSLCEKNDCATFHAFFDATLSKCSKTKKTIFILDNYGTHSSASIVKSLGTAIGYSGSLGVERKSGILKNKESRRAFLTDTTHRIHFVFTPKHCSWLNPIENWFSILQRRVIRNASFESVQDQIQAILDYIEYHNQSQFRRMNWHFTGFQKEKSIAA